MWKYPPPRCLFSHLSPQASSWEMTVRVRRGGRQQLAGGVEEVDKTRLVAQHWHWPLACCRLREVRDTKTALFSRLSHLHAGLQSVTTRPEEQTTAETVAHFIARKCHCTLQQRSRTHKRKWIAFDDEQMSRFSLKVTTYFSDDGKKKRLFSHLHCN